MMLDKGLRKKKKENSGVIVCSDFLPENCWTTSDPCPSPLKTYT